PHRRPPPFPTRRSSDLPGGELAVQEIEDDAPIVRFVNLLISQAISDHASDIHIEPGENELHVRYRIDGVLHEMQRAPKSIQSGRSEEHTSELQSRENLV